MASYNISFSAETADPDNKDSVASLPANRPFTFTITKQTRWSFNFYFKQNSRFSSAISCVQEQVLGILSHPGISQTQQFWGDGMPHHPLLTSLECWAEPAGATRSQDLRIKGEVQARMGTAYYVTPAMSTVISWYKQLFNLRLLCCLSQHYPVIFCFFNLYHGSVHEILKSTMFCQNRLCLMLNCSHVK